MQDGNDTYPLCRQLFKAGVYFYELRLVRIETTFAALSRCSLYDASCRFFSVRYRFTM